MEILESSKICTCNKKFNTNVKSELFNGKTSFICNYCDKIDEEVTEFHNRYDHLPTKQFKQKPQFSIDLIKKDNAKIT